MALSDTCKQALWTLSLFDECGYNLAPLTLCGDNQGSIFLASNPAQSQRTKHIDVRYHFIRDCVEEKKIKMLYIQGTINPADILTKNLTPQKFIEALERLGLVTRPKE
jgi:hypothetical protein